MGPAVETVYTCLRDRRTRDRDHAGPAPCEREPGPIGGKKRRDLISRREWSCRWARPRPSWGCWRRRCRRACRRRSRSTGGGRRRSPGRSHFRSSTRRARYRRSGSRWRSAGHTFAQAPVHALMVPWSFSNWYTVRPVVSTRMSPSLASSSTFTVAFALAAGGGGVAAAGELIVKGTVTVFEIRSRPVSGTTAGAVPLTTKTVRVDGPEPKPALPICQVFHVWVSPPFTVPTPLIWKRPARLVFGPWNGVPGVLGVVDSVHDESGSAAVGAGCERRRGRVVEERLVAGLGGEEGIGRGVPGRQREVDDEAGAVLPGGVLVPGEKTLSLTGIACGLRARTPPRPAMRLAASAIRAVAASVNKAEGSLPARFRCGERLNLRWGSWWDSLGCEHGARGGVLRGYGGSVDSVPIPIGDREPTGGSRRIPRHEARASGHADPVTSHHPHDPRGGARAPEAGGPYATTPHRRPVVRLAFVDPDQLAAFQRREASGVRALYRRVRTARLCGRVPCARPTRSRRGGGPTDVRERMAGGRSLRRRPRPGVVAGDDREARGDRHLPPRGAPAGSGAVRRRRRTTGRWSRCPPSSIRSMRCGTCGAPSTRCRRRKRRSFACNISTA